MTLNKRASVSLTLAATLALSACGGGGGPPVPEGPRGIYISTGDCVDAKLFDLETCRATIEYAIKVHRQTAPVYKTRRICEASEVICERSFRDEFRPRLLAFLVQEGTGKEEGTVAVPLYPPNSMQAGFRSIDDTYYLPKDLTLTFSPMAQKALMANLNTGGDRSKSKGMF
ncbi:MAG: DUF1190 domain-containing protein [Pseudomonadota bacterium]